MRRFYAPSENFNDHKIVLDLEQSRHLRDVLRLRAGDEVRVFDGEGKEFLCIAQEMPKGKNCSTIRILKEIEPTSPESDLDLTLAISILKGDKFDLVIQKSVELGVRKLVPIITKRCDVKLRNADRKIERWQKIIIEASKQCGRAKLMEIVELLEFDDLVEDAEGTKVLFSERNGSKLEEIESSEKITAIIGSEGGWEDSEIDLARQNGVQIITLSGRILRAETAAISITSILQHRFGDLN